MKPLGINALYTQFLLKYDKRLKEHVSDYVLSVNLKRDNHDSSYM